MTNKIPEEVLQQQRIARMVKEEQTSFHKQLLDEAKELGVGVVHIFDKEDPKGGLTVAFRKVKPEYVSTNMVEVAVVTCSYADTFSRKTGSTYALDAFFNSTTIKLPLSAGQPDEDLAGRVKRAFTAMWEIARFAD